jgi:hypothetical protein
MIRALTRDLHIRNQLQGRFSHAWPVSIHWLFRLADLLAFIGLSEKWGKNAQGTFTAYGSF